MALDDRTLHDGATVVRLRSSKRDEGVVDHNLAAIALLSI
jgi:hypothetical protein